jgi:hypothetical protein
LAQASRALCARSSTLHACVLMSNPSIVDCVDRIGGKPSAWPDRTGDNANARSRPLRSATLRTLPSPMMGLPDYPSHLSDVPCPLPQRIERVLVSIASPRMRLSPNGRRVSIRLSLRGLRRLHSVTARRIAQPPKVTYCHKAPAQPVTQPSRSSTSGPIDNYAGGILLHWCFAPSGRTANNRHSWYLLPSAEQRP